jgi:protein-disulfide isomerase
LLAGLPARAQEDGYARGEMALGVEDAPVTIIEYASLTCPHCANFHVNTLPRLKRAYVDTGKVRILYRDFPLNDPALRAAVLARCAGPKRYFPFLDLLYRRQPTWSRAADPLAELARIARLVGMGKAKFDACMADRELGDEILKLRLEGSAKYKIEATPTFVVGGRNYVGFLTFEQFERILEPLLAAQ